MIWTDNMLIPKGAANKYTAELMMDYVYDPPIAAQIADYVYYVSPVKGARRRDQGARSGRAIEPAAVPAGRRRRQAAQLPVPVATSWRPR